METLYAPSNTADGFPAPEASQSSKNPNLRSICVYCGSSNKAAQEHLAAASRLGEAIARSGLRLVYGGGGVGLMGACAKAANDHGGAVLGIIPGFLTHVEEPPQGATTVIVASMHERKMRMFEEADGFAVLPGAIGTLEEAIELLSWRRLGLHAKPVVFYNPGGFWDPLFQLFDRFTVENLMPAAFADCWRAVTAIDDLLPTLATMPTSPIAPSPELAALI